MLLYLDPTVAFRRETMLDEDLKRSLDALRSGSQKLGQLLGLDGILSDIGEDAEQLVQGDSFGAEVGHPADVQARLRAPRPYLSGRCKPHPLHLLLV